MEPASEGGDERDAPRHEPARGGAVGGALPRRPAGFDRPPAAPGGAAGGGVGAPGRVRYVGSGREYAKARLRADLGHAAYRPRPVPLQQSDIDRVERERPRYLFGGQMYWGEPQFEAVDWGAVRGRMRWRAARLRAWLRGPRGRQALAWAVIGVGVAALALGCALALRWDLDGGRWA